MTNPRTVLTEDEVDKIRDLYEGDQHLPRPKRYWTGPRLAEKFEISLRYVRYIIACERRYKSHDEEI